MKYEINDRDIFKALEKLYCCLLMSYSKGEVIGC
jgi:hypothetical protein